PDRAAGDPALAGRELVRHPGYRRPLRRAVLADLGPDQGLVVRLGFGPDDGVPGWRPGGRAAVRAARAPDQAAAAAAAAVPLRVPVGRRGAGRAADVRVVRRHVLHDLLPGERARPG